MAFVSIRHVSKSFDGSPVLRDFTEEFAAHAFVTLLGPSGCGKTTMLRMIAGFIRPDSGSISLGGRVVTDTKTFVPPEEREIGMVFQSYAVWPHMNVFDNIAYPLKVRKKPGDFIRRKTGEILEAVRLADCRKRMPDQLSGGQQQRVALGRALIAEPKLLLLDEPLSNLDAKLRESMRFEIKALQRRYGVTVVYVTHDQTEAMAMSDRIVIIRKGLIQQSGTPAEIYRDPVSLFVAGFVGKITRLPGEASGGRILLGNSGQSVPYSGSLTGPVTVAVRPESVRRAPEGLACAVAACYYLGDTLDLHLDLGGGLLLRMSEPPRGAEIPAEGDRLTVRIRDFLVFPGECDAAGDGRETRPAPLS